MKAYVVLELFWDSRSRSEPNYLHESEPGRPVQAFKKRATAEAYRRALDLQARGGKNPFAYRALRGADGPPDLGPCTTDAGAVRDLLEREGLTAPVSEEGSYEPPEFVSEDPWFTWWQQESAKWTADLRGRLWDALDRVRFYDVAEVDLA